MKFERHAQHADIVVLTTDGSINTETAPDISSSVDELVADGVQKLVVDCSQLKFITSYGLGMLVMIFTKLAKGGGDMKLAALNKHVANSLGISQLTQVFKTYPDLDAACQAFAS